MKKFLATFVGIAAAVASNATTTPATTYSMAPTMEAKNVSMPQAPVLGENTATVDAKDDQSNVVLKKSTNTGAMMAYHSSHASHASHSFHYSSR